MRVYGATFWLAVVAFSGLVLSGCGARSAGSGDGASGEDGLQVERLTEDSPGASSAPLSSLTAPPPAGTHLTAPPPAGTQGAGTTQAGALQVTAPQSLQARLAASEAEAQRLRAELERLRRPESAPKAGHTPVSGTPSAVTMPDGRPIPPPRVLSASEAAMQDKKLATATPAPGTPVDPVQQALASMATPAQAGAKPLTSGSLSIETMPTGVTSGNAASPATSPADRVLPAVRPSTEQAAYKQALDTYEKKRFAESEALFDKFVQSWPQSSLTPNALYWKAECLYSRGKFADAVFIFKDVVTRFPKHAKAPDALLKAIMSYKRLGDKDNANLHYSVLAEDYPASSSLRRAKEMGLGG